MSPALLGGLAAQSTLGAVLGLGGLWLLRHRSPLDRASWLKLALALLLALPWLPRVQVPMPAALAAMMPVQKTATRIEQARAVPVQTSAAPNRSTRPVALPSQAPVQLPSVSTLALLAYGLGVAVLLGHLALGLALLSRWTRRARPFDDRAWQHALRASGAPANTLLLVSDRVRAPLSWGLSRPVILIDPSSALRPADAPAILAHEAAHIAGTDWLALMAARVATALFWFNPLVWVLTRALVQHCEEAADASALLRCAPADYAETLMTCLAGRAGGMGTTRAVPANGMAAGHGLSRRVHQVLDAAPGDLLRRSRGVMVGLTGVASLAVAGSLVSFAAAADLPQLKPGQSWRTVHPDGTVESRYRDRNGDTTISVVKADGHHTTVRVVRNGGHSTVVSDDAADVIPPVPPVPPVPPAPPALPLSAMRDEGDGPLSRAEIARIREEASRARAEGLAQAAAGRAEAERGRREAELGRREAEQARNQALRDAEQARREAMAQADQIRRDALNQANQARVEAMAQAYQARREALAEANRARIEAMAEARAARHAASDSSDN